MEAERRSVFDVVTDFLARQPTDEALLAYALPSDLQARHDELKSIAANSRLSAAQREELGDFRFVEEVMARVKVKIKQRQAQERGAAREEDS